MRATSSAISLSAHIAIVTAAVLGTARARTPERQPYREVPWVLPPSRPERGQTRVPGPIALPDRIDVPTEVPPVILPARGAAARSSPGMSGAPTPKARPVQSRAVQEFFAWFSPRNRVADGAPWRGKRSIALA